MQGEKVYNFVTSHPHIHNTESAAMHLKIRKDSFYASIYKIRQQGYPIQQDDDKRWYVGDFNPGSILQSRIPAARRKVNQASESPTFPTNQSACLLEQLAAKTALDWLLCQVDLYRQLDSQGKRSPIRKIVS